MRVQIVRASASGWQVAELDLPEGARVADAIARSGLAQDGIAGIAIYAERVSPTHLLEDGDRVELLEALRVDPKQARRERAAARGKPGR